MIAIYVANNDLITKPVERQKTLKLTLQEVLKNMPPDTECFTFRSSDEDHSYTFYFPDGVIYDISKLTPETEEYISIPKKVMKECKRLNETRVIRTNKNKYYACADNFANSEIIASGMTGN